MYLQKHIQFFVVFCFSFFPFSFCFSQWAQLSAPTDAWLKDIVCTDANTCYAVGWKGTIIKTSDGGANWTVLNSGTDKYLTSIAAINSTTLVAAGDSGLVLKTTDAGSTWAKSYCNVGMYIYKLMNNKNIIDSGKLIVECC